MIGFWRGGFIDGMYYRPGLYQLRRDGTPYGRPLPNPNIRATHRSSPDNMRPPMSPVRPAPPGIHPGSWEIPGETLAAWKAVLTDAIDLLNQVIADLTVESTEQRARLLHMILADLQRAIDRRERS